MKKIPCKDHLGNVYPSISQMLKEYNIAPSVFCKYIKQGMSIEDIFTKKYNLNRYSKCKKDYCDHLGNHFSTFFEMCKFYHKGTNTVRELLNKGWSLQDALTKKNDNFKTCIDHLGNHYKSVVDMCAFYKVPRSMFDSRIKKGWTVKDALTTPKYSYTIFDHNGKQYNSLKEMCNAYNISVSTYRKRIKEGCTIENALTLSMKYKQGNNKLCKDHLGNEYPSLKEMCHHYGITTSSYQQRIKNYSLEQTLTTPLNKYDNGQIPCFDHLGNSFSSIKAMCDYWNILPGTYRKRLKHNFSKEEALTIPRNMYIGEYRVAEYLKRLNIKFYHDCSIKTIFTDLRISVDWNDFLLEFQTKLGLAGYNWSKQKIQRLRPDFVLYTDEDNKIRGVIEFDGEQHQNFVEFFFKTIEEFLKRSNTDFIKQSLWEYLNIPMLRIRHDQIDMIDDMVQDFIDNSQNYIHNHNTYLSEEEYWSILIEQKTQIKMAFAV